MKAVAIDFDGVIHKYSQGWKDGRIYDEPVEGSFEAIERLMEYGYTVFVFTTRKPGPVVEWLESNYYAFIINRKNRPEVAPFDIMKIPRRMKFWNNRGVLGVTNRKLPAVAYIDDRAVRFGSVFQGKESWSKAMDDLINIELGR